MLNVSVMCFFASYLLALAFEVVRFYRRSTLVEVLHLGMTAAGLVAQTLYLGLRSRETQLPPLLSSLSDWLLVLSWLVVLLYLVFVLSDRTFRAGILVLPLVMALILAAWFGGGRSRPPENLPVSKNWLMLHVSLLVFGTAAILGGLVLSLLYLWQHRRLKHGRARHGGLALPSLERLERLNRWALLTAVPLLTLGLIIGVGLTTQEPASWATWADPVVLTGSVCWLMMVGVFVYVLGRQRAPGRQVAWLTAVSCGFLLLTVVGSQVLTGATHLQTVHGRTPPPAAP
ncbi:cytochrome c biogenesis protein CcsA [Planctellipticum variicoloris]|uniref:cytochrome c biogenesis protein CcsA n=1 Tax=Planctellipticum variicoloris TaxID=3064265 RepID=UPI0030140D6C|nr:cytochrome c biogenesis protein [Planctomycetaceae bacterium SH412]